MSKINKVKEYLSLQKETGINWDDTGLLAELSVEHAALLASKFDEIARILLSDVHKIRPETETVIFTIVRRVLTAYNHLIQSCIRTILYVDKRYGEMEFELQELSKKSYNSIDVDAEFCAALAEEIANLKL